MLLTSGKPIRRNFDKAIQTSSEMAHWLRQPSAGAAFTCICSVSKACHIVQAVPQHIGCSSCAWLWQVAQIEVLVQNRVIPTCGFLHSDQAQISFVRASAPCMAAIGEDFAERMVVLNTTYSRYTLMLMRNCTGAHYVSMAVGSKVNNVQRNRPVTAFQLSPQIMLSDIV